MPKKVPSCEKSTTRGFIVQCFRLFCVLVEGPKVVGVVGDPTM